MMMYFEWNQKTIGDYHRGTWKKTKVKRSKIHKDFWTTRKWTTGESQSYIRTFGKSKKYIKDFLDHRKAKGKSENQKRIKLFNFVLSNFRPLTGDSRI